MPFSHWPFTSLEVDGPLITYSKGFIGSIPAGGHWAPNSIPGFNELWKNAQKMLAKNNPSERINKKTPKFNPLWTALVWLPKYVKNYIYLYIYWAISY